MSTIENITCAALTVALILVSLLSGCGGEPPPETDQFWCHNPDLVGPRAPCGPQP